MWTVNCSLSPLRRACRVLSNQEQQLKEPPAGMKANSPGPQRTLLQGFSSATENQLLQLNVTRVNLDVLHNATYWRVLEADDF